MSGADKLLVDTNIFIYVLEGNKFAAQSLVGKDIFFSFITSIELMGNIKINKEIQSVIESFLSHHQKITYYDKIEKTAIQLKQKKRLKTPDAIIAATAIEFNLPLLTADKNLEKIEGLNCILFEA